MDSLHFSELRLSEDSINRRDRLSELPDSLILAILSFLEMKDVAATTLLSKRWKNLWTTVPCLRFFNCLNDFDSLRRFVYKALSLWKGSKIHKFRIDIVSDTSLTRDLDSWLLFAIEKQVEELYIGFFVTRFMSPFREIEYYAPQCLLSCQSITKLSLICCELELKESVKWNILKSLTIDSVNSLSEDAMNSILSGSPQLEVLNLSNCDGYHHLNIRSSSLKMLKIDRYEILRGEVKVDKVLSIWAPNLEILEFSDASYAKCSMSVPSLTTAILCFHHRESGNVVFSPQDVNHETVRQVILGVCHAEKVTLSVSSTKVLLEMREEGVLVPFSKAKHLKLKASVASEILGVLEFFPNLTMLIVEFVSLVSLFDSLMGVKQCFESVEPTTVLPSPSFPDLRTIEITWHALDTSIFPSIELMLRDAHLLEKLVFRPKSGRDNQDMLLLAEEKMMSMRRASPTAEVIVIKDSD